MKRNSSAGNIKRNLTLWLLSVISALMLSLPFLLPHMGFLALFAFIPLFAAEEMATRSGKRHFWLCYYGCFLIWNLLTTYWIYNATLPGMIAAVTLNALQMAIVFRLFRWMRKLTQGFLPYLFFIAAWLAWEHAYFNWDVSWPWLVLGNSFATSIKSVQWYEFTGTLGGSLWVLLVNTLVFRIIKGRTEGQKMPLSSLSAALVIILPLILSHIMFHKYEEPFFDPSSNSGSRQFTILQPNIDPYTDKFYGMSQDQQNRVLLDLSGKALAESSGKNKMEADSVVEDNPAVAPAHFILAPETFISRRPLINEDMPYRTPSFVTFREYVERCNEGGGNYNMIIGAVTDDIYYDYNVVDKDGRPVPPTESARYIEHDNLWYDRANTAMFLDAEGGYEFYHKSKLVVLVESTPYKKLFNLMSRFSIDLGGAIGSYATQEEREVFVTPDSVKIGTAVCYESVYGDYYREYILKGAQVMSIITNDGWWGDTPGYHQHLSYASLRAIETRRAIARCANTGISAFINQRGEIISHTEWWKPAYLNGSLPLNDRLTVFVRHGDIIGRVSQFLFFLLLLMGIVVRFRRS